MRLPRGLGLGSAAMVLLATRLCHAAHPLQTEDTGTQGAGSVEVENGAARSRMPGSCQVDQAARVQFSLGLTPTIDLLLQPSWLRQGQASERQRGQGDSNLDLKWRWYSAAPWSLGLRAGFTLPTAQRGLGLPPGTLGSHATLVATWDAAPFMVHANVGHAHGPSANGMRRDARHVSAAMTWAVNSRLVVSAEVAADTDTDARRSRWPANGLTALIWTLRPGLDLDIGYLASVRSQPSSRAWLAGLTWRFTP